MELNPKAIGLAPRLVGILAWSLLMVLVASLLQGRRVDEVFRTTYARTTEAHEATRLALEAQVHFKKQVQEWKNILLRGANDADLADYRGRFTRESKQVTALTGALLDVLPLNSRPRRTAQAFANAHAALQDQYAQGLSQFLEDRRDPFRVDAAVRGIDREPTALLATVVEGVRAWRDARIEEATAALARARRDAYAMQAIVFMVGAILTLLALRRWVYRPIRRATDLAERISDGQLEQALEVRDAPGEIGRLLVSLQSMQDALRVMRDDRERHLKKLVRAKDEAQAGDRAKLQFLSKVSHELITPLNGIMGSLTLIESEVPGRSMPNVAQAIESSQMLHTLVNRVLKQTQREREHAGLHEEPFAPRDILPAIEQTFSVHARARGLQLSIDIDQAVPATVVGDKEKLGEVVEDLVDNAIKFTRAGSVEVRMAPATQFDGGLRVEVSDTGIGIAESDQRRIFERFAQVDESNTREHGGLGLGLAQCRDNVKMMGGHIEVRSQVERGSTFMIEVPMAAVDGSAPAAPAR